MAALSRCLSITGAPKRATQTSVAFSNQSSYEISRSRGIPSVFPKSSESKTHAHRTTQLRMRGRQLATVSREWSHPSLLVPTLVHARCCVQYADLGNGRMHCNQVFVIHSKIRAERPKARVS